MDSSRYIWLKFFSAIVFCLIVANLVFLNTVVWQIKYRQPQIAVTPTLGPSQILNLSQTPTPQKTNPTLTSAIVAPTLVTKITIPTQAPSSKELFIPFGTGTSNAADWTDVAGLQVSLDSNNYPNIKSVVFEISLRNAAATQEIDARLYNVTDNHPVWYSDVSYSGGNTGILLISNPVTLDIGVKTYRVQVKTQLQAPALIDQSRLHIILK